MRKLWASVKGWVSRLDTFDARKSVAADLRLAAALFFVLFLASLPAASPVVVVALAAALKVEVGTLAVTTATSVGLFLSAAVLRVVAFLMELKLTAKTDSVATPSAPAKAKKAAKGKSKRSS